jgi:hypothetical protein
MTTSTGEIGREKFVPSEFSVGRLRYAGWHLSDS